jgi:hypothetical protein
MNPDDIELYLLKGSKLTSGQINRAYDAANGVLQDTDSQAIIFAMKDGVTILFKLRELSLKRWGDFKNNRIGRLVPPFLTRLQQRFSAYIQRPGLTRVPAEAIPNSAPVNATLADSPTSSDPKSIRASLSDLWAATKRAVHQSFNARNRNR